jgi:hypothetical protein
MTNNIMTSMPDQDSELSLPNKIPSVVETKVADVDALRCR